MSKALDALKKYHEENNYEWSAASVEETLQECCAKVYEERVGSLRWVDIYFYVVDLNGVLIGYTGYKTTGDTPARDHGYFFELGSICDVKKMAATKVVTTYQKVGEND